VVVVVALCCCLGIANGLSFQCFSPVNFEQSTSMRCWAAALTAVKGPCNFCDLSNLESWIVRKHREKGRVGPDDTLDKFKFEETMKDESATETGDMVAITQGDLDSFMQRNVDKYPNFCMQFILVSYSPEGLFIGHAIVVYGKSGDDYFWMNPAQPASYFRGNYTTMIYRDSYTIAAFATTPCKCNNKMCCAFGSPNPIDEFCSDYQCSNCCVPIITRGGGNFRQTKQGGMFAKRRRARLRHRTYAAGK